MTFVLSGLLLFLFAPVVYKKHFYVFLRLHQFLHSLSCFPIARIFCFFLFQKLNIFDAQFFYLRKFFQPSLIESRFGRLVQRNALPICFQESLAVSCFSIGLMDGPCFGIVDNVRFHYRNFCHPRFRSFDGVAQFVIAHRCSTHLFFHFIHAPDFVFLQKISVLDISFRLYRFAHRA